MDLRSLAIVILDHEKRVLFSNSAAHSYFSVIPTLKTADGKWSGPTPSEGEVLELEGDSEGARIRLVRTWISNGRPDVGYAGIILCPLGMKPEDRRGKLVKKFAFTPAELKLVELLLEGQRPQTAAVALGITIHTVRTYLKRLYRKVGVRSQSTLVCALNRALE
jgi:DNA-binding CsgD family transcriptional regulator